MGDTGLDVGTEEGDDPGDTCGRPALDLALAGRPAGEVGTEAVVASTRADAGEEGEAGASTREREDGWDSGVDEAAGTTSWGTTTGLDTTTEGCSHVVLRSHVRCNSRIRVPD